MTIFKDTILLELSDNAVECNLLTKNRTTL